MFWWVQRDDAGGGREVGIEQPNLTHQISDCRLPTHMSTCQVLEISHLWFCRSAVLVTIMGVVDKVQG